MVSFKNAVGFVILTVISLLLVGCSDSKVVPVSGTLTYKGQPVPNAIIHFVPEKGRPSRGETDAQGRFTLTYDPQTKGAQRAKHRVFVEYNALAAQSTPGAIPGMTVRLSEEQKAFFDKYSGDNSTAEITIDKEMKDLKLEWD
jgi:hypothetical protein